MVTLIMTLVTKSHDPSSACHTVVAAEGQRKCAEIPQARIGRGLGFLWGHVRGFSIG